MASRVEISGLREAQANFEKLNEAAQRQIGRAAMREMGWVLARPIRAATYTTFQRRSGLIKSGLGVAVRREPQDDQLTGYVEQFAQSGLASPFGALVRSRRRRQAGTKAAGNRQIAFWWRFLEFGTGPRRATRTPSFLRTGKVARSGKGQIKQIGSLRRWLATPNRGGIQGRSWIRPVFASQALTAITAFRDTFIKLVDAAVSAMPKK